jgi:hypothetical protein
MRKLVFIGRVRTGNGRFAQDMVIPGRDNLFLKPDDWPRQLAPGTLNVLVNDDGFPAGFDEIGKGEGLTKLDEGKFGRALLISPWKIAGNTIKYDSDNPTRGMGEIWRAELQVIATGQTTKCWMFRRIGSDLTSEIELVAEENLRTRLNLSDGMAVKVTVWETKSDYKPKTPTEIFHEWCEAARNIEGGFGEEKAMGYLIGEKFLNFLDVAETNREWREAVPAFVAEIKGIFEPWKLAQFLDTPRRLGALGHTATDEGHRLLRASLEESEKTKEDARNLMLIEWARELLLEESGPES